MAKILAYFPLHLPSKGHFHEMDGGTTHPYRYWVDKEICNSMEAELSRSRASISALDGSYCTLLGRSATAFATR